MRNRVLATAIVLALATCKPRESPLGFDIKTVPPPPANHKLVQVTMTITGMVILNTTTDDAKFMLLIPEVTDHDPIIYAKTSHDMSRPIGAVTRIPVEQTSGSGEKYDVLVLTDEDLSVDPKPITALDYEIGSAGCPIKLKDLERLRWAPSFTNALGRTVTVNPKYTNTPPEKAGLHARMNIEHGYVFSQPEHLYKWQFRNTFSGGGSGGHKQILTTMVIQRFAVYLPDADPYLHIKSTPFGGTIEELVKLSPDANNEINFTIGNPHKNHRLPSSGGSNLDEDPHFPHYYKLLLDKDGNAVSSMIRPFKLRQEYCLPPVDSLVNCGPGRP